jgi:hypothetical protein
MTKLMLPRQTLPLRSERGSIPFEQAQVRFLRRLENGSLQITSSEKNGRPLAARTLWKAQPRQLRTPVLC